MIRVSLHPAFDCDFVVAGAGPAGSAAACHLAEQGYRVILADRQEFPRDKVCGDFISPVSLRELDKFAPGFLQDIGKVYKIRSAGVYMDGRPLIRRDMPSISGLSEYGTVIPRRQFDTYLLALARDTGVTVLEGYRVETFSLHRDGINVMCRHGGATCTLTARALVGADGSGSAIAKKLRGYATPRRDRIVAIRAYMTGVENTGDTAYLFFNSESFPGYAWLFPTGHDSANIGFGFLSETIPPAKVNLHRSFQQMIRQDPALQEFLKNAHIIGKPASWAVPVYNPFYPIFGERVLLVGDAAGLANPLNGEGIQFALQSARLAADTLGIAAERENFSAEVMADYSRKVHDALDCDMAVSRFIIQMIRNRALNPVWMRTIRAAAARADSDPSYGNVIGGVLAGFIPTGELLNISVAGDTLREALHLANDEVVACIRDPKRLDFMNAEMLDSATAASDIILRNPTELFLWSCGIIESSTDLALRLAERLTT